MEKTLPEIETKFNTLSPFLKMEYLEECSKQNSDLNIKKFCCQKLAELYEIKSMFSEAAKNMSSLADMAVTFKDKINCFLKEIELWIKSGQYELADETYKMALAIGNTHEKEDIKKAVKELYKNQSLNFEKTNKNANALKIYEKLLHLVEEREKLEIKKRILPLYKKLGKIHEYTVLEEQLGKKV